MNKTDIRIYNEPLDVDGTIAQLIDWAYRYDSDYSDEALDYISARAESLGLPQEQAAIPVLVKLARHRDSENKTTGNHSLPYESMKLDKIRGGKISYSATAPYGEVEILEEGGKVLIAITGNDDAGFFTAANTYRLDDFMGGSGGWLEQAIGETLFYGKCREG